MKQDLSFIKKDVIYDIDKITRFEVIDETGRAYIRNNINVSFSLQDDSKTLKIFIKK